jgi:DNA-binding CsgD family transcriptional regulator
MTDQDVLGQLKGLTERQREVLSLVCEGLLYKEIGEKLFITENAVKAHMANIHEKLGLIYVSRSIRKKALFETYCPALKSGHFEPSENEPIEPEPASEEAIKVVEEDERALMVVKPEIIDIIPPEEPKKKKRRRNGWKWILILIIISLLAFGVFKLYEFVADFIGSLQIQAAPDQEEEQKPVAQVIPTNTTRLPEPTTRPTNTVFTPIPQPTRTPAPKITLPFNDTFSQGFNSVWDLQYADWIITNGKASIIQTENLDTGWAIINDPTLNNYRLKVHVDTPHMYSAAQGETYILVRYDQNRDKQLLLNLDRLQYVFWGMTRGLQNTIDPITDTAKYEFPASADIVIEANGNNFTAWVAGQMIGSISVSGYDRGGVGLGIFCTYTDCPTLSDFILEPIN